MAKKFSPPYGDGTICLLLEQQKGWFSPPYGDSTLNPFNALQSVGFSPPYGDSTGVCCVRHDHT